MKLFGEEYFGIISAILTLLILSQTPLLPVLWKVLSYRHPLVRGTEMNQSDGVDLSDLLFLA